MTLRTWYTEEELEHGHNFEEDHEEKYRSGGEDDEEWPGDGEA